VKIDFTLFPEPNEDKIVKEYSGRNMEEYKRLFYVACTRAREKLFLTGVVGNKIKKDSWLGLLERNQLISFVDNRLQWSDELSSIIKVDEYSEIPFIKPYIPEKAKVKTFYDYPVKEQVNVLYMQPSRLISDKFEKMSLDLYLKEVGEIIHMVMEKYTKGLIASSELEPESLRLFKYQHDSPIKSILINCIKLIEQSEVIEIAAPGQNKFAEIPFVYREGNSYWKGRADLVEVSEDKLIIYDYKVHKLDSAELKNMYYPQLELYAKALSKIWKNRDIHMRIVHINPLSGVKILEVGRINKREDFL
jgi:ATP-dependent exoDNAse (exonuclease V) beta subunit